MGCSIVLADGLFDSSLMRRLFDSAWGGYTSVDGLVDVLLNWSVVVRIDRTAASVDGSVAASFDNGLFDCVGR